MTCIVAIKHGNELVVAADGQVTSMTDTVVSDNGSKVINLNDEVVMAFAGGSQLCDATISAVYSAGDETKRLLARAKTKCGVRHVLGNLIEVAKKDLARFIDDERDSLTMQCILANREGIWLVDAQGYAISADTIPVVAPSISFVAIGSGHLVAKGAIHALLSSQRSIPISNVAIAAVAAAERYVTSCGRLRQIEELTFEE